MKKYLYGLVILIVISCNTAVAQDYPRGTPIGRIFADYKYSLNNNNPYNGFGVGRAWLGYKYLINDNFTAQVILDLGSTPLSMPEVSSKRYGFLRNALVSYKKENLTITFGVTDIRAGKAELQLWGKRYLSVPFLLKYKYANVADIGIVVDYKVSDLISIDAAIINGEGYTKIEADNSQQFAFGISITPVDGLLIRAYGDTYKLEDGTQNTFSSTAGYVHEKFTIAAGYNYKADFERTDGTNTSGFTVFGAYNLTPKLEIFGRYDDLNSVILAGDIDPWNFAKDGSLVVTGLQYKLMKQLKFAVSYQGWTPDDNTVNRWDFVQINTEFRF